MHRGYIKIWRKLEESGLLQMPETLATMLFLILHAAHKATKRGTKYGIVELERGQGILAIRVLAKDMNLSIQTIRTILVRLEKLEILTLKPTHSFSIYTIVNYSKYNDVSEQSTRELTNQQHTINTPSTQEQELKHLSIKEETPVASDAGIPACPHERIVALYHEVLPKLPAVRVWNEKRRRALQSRWREDESRQNLEFWGKYFRYVSTSNFLCGRTGAFQATLEWLVNSSNFVKVIEGNYENRS